MAFASYNPAGRVSRPAQNDTACSSPNLTSCAMWLLIYLFVSGSIRPRCHVSPMADTAVKLNPSFRFPLWAVLQSCALLSALKASMHITGGNALASLCLIPRRLADYDQQPTMSSSAQDPVPQINIGRTFGALFIGVTFAAVFVDDLLVMQSKLCISSCPDLFSKQSLWSKQRSSFRLLSDA